MVKRYTASQIQKLHTCDEFNFVDEANYDAILALARRLRQILAPIAIATGANEMVSVNDVLRDSAWLEE